MVLFVDHDAERLPAVHHHRAADALRRVLAADQMPLHQHLFLERGEILQQFRKRILHLWQLFDARLDQFKNLGALELLRPAGKWPVPEIARQPDATADHDLVMRTFSAQPLAAARHDIREFHEWLVKSASSCLIWSRNEAAVS